MAWIEFHEQLRDHYKVQRLSKLLKIPYTQALGHLACLWTWAAGNARDGNLKKLTDDEIAYAAKWDGQVNGFVGHLIASGFLEKDRTIHDWTKHGVRFLEQAKSRTAQWKRDKQR